MIFLALMLLTGCKEKIVHNLTEVEANRFLTRLHQEQIEAEKELQSDGTWAIAVQQRNAMDALNALATAREFRRTQSEGGGTKAGLLATREAQRFQYERALSHEIEMTVGALSGVLEARVHLNLPVTDPLLGKPILPSFDPSGSILIVSDRSFSVNRDELARLVSGASGIIPERITVLIVSDSEEGELNSQVPQEVVPPPVLQPDVLTPSKQEVEELTAHSGKSNSDKSLLLILSGALLFLGACALIVLYLPVRALSRSRRRRPRGGDQLEGLLRAV